MKKNRDLILVLLSNSLGEIHFILPYLRKLGTNTDVDVFFYFINDKIYKKAIDDPFYYDQIVAHATILKPNDLFDFLVSNGRRVTLILKDTTPLTPKSIVFRIKQICSRASLVLFPHAYALLGYQQRTETQGATNKLEDKYVDHVLYVHPFDVPVLTQRYDVKKMLFAGALGYSRWWANEVGKYVKQNLDKLQVQVPDGKVIVLLTLRDVHKLFLSEENFDYLLRSSMEFLFQKTDCFVIIKPHPRQDIGRLQTALQDVPQERYTISYLNTFVISKFAHVNLSFWSSAVTDCLAMGVPSIEFHRYHTPFNQTVERGGTLHSFYSHLHLTTPVQSKEALQQVFPLSRDKIAQLFAAQKLALDNVFAEADKGFENFQALMNPNQRRQMVHLTDKVISFVYFFLKFVFRKFKPV
jgi:hypothetical protein